MLFAVGKAQLQPVRGVPERADRAECDGAPRPPRSEQVQNAEEEGEAGLEEEREAGLTADVDRHQLRVAGPTRA